MIVCVTGTQGQGKTHLLNQLKTIGYNVRYNTTARDTLSEQHITLEEVYTNPNLSISFQNEILKKQIEFDKEFNASNEIYLSERSYIDIFVYALMAVGRLNKFDTWLQTYYEKCLKAQQACGGVIYLHGREFVPENDGVRSISKLFSDSVDVVMAHHVSILAQSHPVISVSNVNRVNDTIKALKQIGGQHG